MVKGKEQSSSVTLDLSDSSWDSLSDPVKAFLKKQGVSEKNFQKSTDSSADRPSISKRRFKLGERNHRPVSEPESEVNEEGDPAIGPGATARELSHHQANMEEGDPHAVEADPDAEEAETAEELEARRLSRFAERYVGDGKNPATGRAFTKEEIILIYQKYQELNPNINDILDVDHRQAFDELRRELENLTSSESDPDRREYLIETTYIFTDGGLGAYHLSESELRGQFSTLEANISNIIEDIDDPTRKSRFEGIIDAAKGYGLGPDDILGDVEDVIEEELARETNQDHKKELKELLEGIRDRVAIESAERFARNNAHRVAPNYEIEFVDWVKKITEAQGARGTKEMRKENKVGGWMVAYDTYAILNYLAGGSEKAEPGQPGAETEDAKAEHGLLLPSGVPNYEAIYAKMKENKNRSINWRKVEAFSPYGRELHNYVLAQESLRSIEAIDASDRMIYDNKRRERDEWRAVLEGKKEPTKRQLDLYQGFVQAEMGKAFSEDLKRAQMVLEDARNLATYDHLREEGRTIKRILDAHGEGLSEEDQAYYDSVRDGAVRRSIASNIYDEIIAAAGLEIRIAEDPTSGYVDMGEDEGNPERFIEKKRKEIADKYGPLDFAMYASSRTTMIKTKLRKPPLVGLHKRVDAMKAKLPEGETLDDLVARREAQQRYLLDLNERYRTGKGRTEQENREIQAYRAKVGSRLKYYEHLRSVVEEKKQSHELNVAAYERISDILERDQGRFSAAVFGDYLGRSGDAIFAEDVAEINEQKPEWLQEAPATTETRGFLAAHRKAEASGPETAHDPQMDAEISKWREEKKAKLEARMPKFLKDAEAYLFGRYGTKLDIIGVDTEDHPGKIDVLKAMEADLADHVEALYQRLEHFPKTMYADLESRDKESQNMLMLIIEKSQAEAALRCLSAMVKLAEQDAAEETDTSRIQVSGVGEKLAEAA